MTIKANEIMSKKKTLIIIALHGLKNFYHLQNFIKEVGNKPEYTKLEVYSWLGYDCFSFENI